MSEPGTNTRTSRHGDGETAFGHPEDKSVSGDNLAALGMRIMEGSASEAEQRHYAKRLIAVGERLRRRADGMRGEVVEGEVLVNAEIVTKTAPNPRWF